MFSATEKSDDLYFNNRFIFLFQDSTRVISCHRCVYRSDDLEVNSGPRFGSILRVLHVALMECFEMLPSVSKYVDPDRSL